MPIKTPAVAMTGTTPVLLASGQPGRVGVPVTATVQVPAAAGVSVFVGGSDVTAATGIEVLPGGAWIEDLYASDDLYGVLLAAGTPTVRVLKSRQ